MFTYELEFLSNFYHCPNGVFIEPDLDGSLFAFPTAEHAYTFSKIAPTDTVTREKILAAKTPGEAKRLGRNGLMKSGWELPGMEGKVAAMQRVLEAKFKDLTLAAKLVATGEMRLVEYNTWHDNFWGSCTCASCVRIRSTKVGKPTEGENWLGQLLMQLRATIRGRWTKAEAERGYK